MSNPEQPAAGPISTIDWLASIRLFRWTLVPVWNGLAWLIYSFLWKWMLEPLGRWTLIHVPLLRPLAHLVAYYPILLLVLFPLYGLVFGVLMAEYDAFHLVWSDDFLHGIGNGMAVALLLGGILLAVQRLDQKFLYLPREELDAQRVANPLVEYPEVRHYWYAWWLLIAVAAAPNFVSESQFRVEYPVTGETAQCPSCPEVPPGITHHEDDRIVVPTDGDHLEDVVADIRWAAWWFPIGMFLVGAVISIASRLGVRADPLNIARLLAFPISIGFFVLMGVYSLSPPEYDSPLRDFLPASIPLFFLLGFATVLLTTINWYSDTYLLRPILILLLVVPFLIPACQTRHRVPGMEIGNGPTTYYDGCERPNLWCYDQLRAKPREATGLASDDDALKAWNDRMVERYGGPRPVIVVSVSGGASASALYTADVLFTLELETPGFSDQVRIVTGASGGMLGASYFVSRFHPKSKSGLFAARDKYAAAWKRWFKDHQGTQKEFEDAELEYRNAVGAAREIARTQLGYDFLSPIVQQWVHKDMPLGALPIATTNDRGMALELSWRKRLDDTLDIPFKSYRDAEQAGQLPSIVFTPMMIEDGRQLIISNLDLDYMVDSVVPERMPGEGRTKSPVERPSHTAIEFFRLFPHADRFKLSTAVRLNASFPYLSPSPALPTNPERHVVDAGYYDNYGTLTATKWVIRNVDGLNSFWWKSYAKAYGYPTQPVQTVYLLQIRCFAFESESRSFVKAQECKEVERVGACGVARTESGLYTLTAPLVGLFSSWRSNMVYRGDERVDATQIFSRQKTADPEHPSWEMRVDRVLYECPFEPSLNWALTDATRWRLRAGSGRQIERDIGGVRTQFQTAYNSAATAATAVGGAPVGAPVSLERMTKLGEKEYPDRGRSPADGRREFYWHQLAYRQAQPMK